MDHTWNTVMHSTLGVSPYEAAHGLPARGVHCRVAAAEYCAPDYMDEAGIKAMQTTAKAFVTHLRQVQTQEAKARAWLLNQKGHAPKLAVGDKVSFSFPPQPKKHNWPPGKRNTCRSFEGLRPSAKS